MKSFFKKQIINEWLPMLKLWFLLLEITVIYAFLSTGVAQILFHEKARGSFIQYHHQTIGSRLYGQKFVSSEYFWGRPSMTAYQHDIPNADNIHWVGDSYWKRYKQQSVLGLKNSTSELLWPSSSQVDPHVSLESIQLQIPRILTTRSITLEALQALIVKHTQKPFLGIFGKTTVNVLELNVGLDQYMEKHHVTSHT